jgi:hypothetical protein
LHEEVQTEKRLKRKSYVKFTITIDFVHNTPTLHSHQLPKLLPTNFQRKENLANLCMKNDRFFFSPYHIEISQTTRDSIVGKPLLRRGAPSWFHNILTYNGEVIEY